MSEDIYHQRIMDLAAAAAGEGRIENPDAAATADNPLCGDRVTVEVRLDHGSVAELAHRTRGCVLTRAAAGVLAAAAPGETGAGVAAAAEALRAMLDDGSPPPGGKWEGLEAFVPVAAHKSRHDCVLLPFQALLKALGK